MKKLMALVGLLFAVQALAWAQSADHPYRGQGYVFLGFGFGVIPGYNGPALYFNYPTSFQNMRQLGFGGEAFLYKGLGAGAEASHASWGGSYDTAWIGSGDLSYHFRRHAARFGVDPFVLGGVSIVGPRWEGGVAHPQETTEAARTYGWLSTPHCVWNFEMSSALTSGDSPTSCRFVSALRSDNTETETYPVPPCALGIEMNSCGNST